MTHIGDQIKDVSRMLDLAEPGNETFAAGQMFLLTKQLLNSCKTRDRLCLPAKA